MKKLLFLFTILLLISCSTDESDSCIPTPTLTTENPINVTDVSATVSGTINPPTCDESSSISSQGFVYSKYPQPQINQDSVVEISGVNITHTFSFNQNSTYYVRTFLENNSGIFYGNEIEVNTTVGNLIITTGEFLRVKSTTFSVRTNTIDDLGGGVLKRFGVCWSTNQNPTIQDNFKEIQGGYNYSGFDTEIENLQKNTSYYVRAFGENEGGVFYGNEKIVNTSFGYTDYEGNFYETVLLENITFTAKNLSTSYYSNGDEILKVNSIGQSNQTINNGVGAWCYYNFDDNNSHLGKLYNYHAINDDRGIGMDNWVIPSEQDLQNSFDIVGGINNSPESTDVGVWKGNRASYLKEGGVSGFDAKLSSTHSYGRIQITPIFQMYSSSLYFTDRWPGYTFVVTRTLIFDNSTNNDKVNLSAGSLPGTNWIHVRLIKK
jgi:uncharacterized protein (TIGR02145 family)